MSRHHVQACHGERNVLVVAGYDRPLRELFLQVLVEPSGTSVADDEIVYSMPIRLLAKCPAPGYLRAVDPRGFPTTLPEFQRVFPSDAACAAYLEKLRWPGGFACPTCGTVGEPYRFPKRSSVVLRCRGCQANVSLTAGTVMQASHMPLSMWFWGAYLVRTQTPGQSALQFQRQLGISRYETAFQTPSQVARRDGATRPRHHWRALPRRDRRNARRRAHAWRRPGCPPQGDSCWGHRGASPS